MVASIVTKQDKQSKASRITMDFWNDPESKPRTNVVSMSVCANEWHIGTTSDNWSGWGDKCKSRWLRVRKDNIGRFPYLAFHPSLKSIQVNLPYIEKKSNIA